MPLPPHTCTHADHRHASCVRAACVLQGNVHRGLLSLAAAMRRPTCMRRPTDPQRRHQCVRGRTAVRLVRWLEGCLVPCKPLTCTAMYRLAVVGVGLQVCEEPQRHAAHQQRRHGHQPVPARGDVQQHQQPHHALRPHRVELLQRHLHGAWRPGGMPHTALQSACMPAATAAACAAGCMPAALPAHIKPACVSAWEGCTLSC